ncbi:hypothetical protein PIB30_053326 [Stylosanthes scabra]|uniref:DUF4219 domain-containing protein n=1 Tax=Stylosanthes scabra TaxID=79078 RepID=A0ABU6QIU9_9FABA|nr:hypothetical protein [Stylosanthes scabra]
MSSVADVAAEVAADVSSRWDLILNGSNHAHWVEVMRGFLKRRKLWRYMTGDIVCPVKSTVATTSADGTSKSTEVVEKDFADKLED